MAYRHIFDPVAAKEYEEAFMWYEERSFSASDNFVLSLKNAINIICESPHRYRNTYKNLREYSLKKYPFNLIYLIDENKKLVTIISIYHHKRNPKTKYNKPKVKKK